MVFGLVSFLFFPFLSFPFLFLCLFVCCGEGGSMIVREGEGEATLQGGTHFLKRV